MISHYHWPCRLSSIDDQSHPNTEDMIKWRKYYYPRDRLRGYLEARGLWDENQEQDLLCQVKSNIETSVDR